jgi:plastocyanin
MRASGAARRRLPVVVIALGVALGAGCGGDDGPTSDEAVPDDPDAVVVAEDMAFEPGEVEVAAGEPVTLVIDNRDDGVEHNIRVEGAPEPNGTPLRLGPSQQALTVELEAGEHAVTCDIHPNMEATVVAG